MRQGRFRKHLINEEFLKAEAPQFLNLFTPYLDYWQKKILSDPEIVLLYIVTYTYLRKGNIIGSRKKSEYLQIPSYKILDLPTNQLTEYLHNTFGDISLYDLVQTCVFRSVPLENNLAIIRWMKREIKLNIFHNIPSVHDVLLSQCIGERCVTMSISQDRISKYILGQRDPLGFLLHDLIHAEKFFGNPNIIEGQLGFYKSMKKLYDNKFFIDLFEMDDKFADELEYVLSDMNAYCIHLLKYFKGILNKNLDEKTYKIKVEEFLGILEFNSSEKNAFLDLNGPEFNLEQNEILAGYFNKNH